MHTTDTRHRFLELRAQGWSLSRIAAELDLAKSTLAVWNREQRREIADLKTIELETVQERILVSHEEELRRLTAHLNRLEVILAQRNLECLSTESLFNLAAIVRAQLRRVTAPPCVMLEEAVASASPSPVPAADQP